MTVRELRKQRIAVVEGTLKELYALHDGLARRIAKLERERSAQKALLLRREDSDDRR
jgi:hypothetical protein